MDKYKWREGQEMHREFVMWGSIVKCLHLLRQRAYWYPCDLLGWLSACRKVWIHCTTCAYAVSTPTADKMFKTYPTFREQFITVTKVCHYYITLGSSYSWNLCLYSPCYYVPLMSSFPKCLLSIRFKVNIWCAIMVLPVYMCMGDSMLYKNFGGWWLHGKWLYTFERMWCVLVNVAIRWR